MTLVGKNKMLQKMQEIITKIESYVYEWSCRAVDKAWNMEHSGTFWNIPQHPGTGNNYDNYENEICKIKFSKVKWKKNKLVSAR